MLTAGTTTSARTARKVDMGRKTVGIKPYHEVLGMRPKYLRYNLWPTTHERTPTIADWSETASPLPCPPLSELNNPVVLWTISENPSLFQIITPINVDRFENLLCDHPNPAFVKSVCSGLQEGFWPWADTLKPGYPVIYDGSRPTPPDAHKVVLGSPVSRLRKDRD